jgi:hypothetical protein
MKTLGIEGFDFKDAYPVPRDAERRRAGRQGLLDQKEDAGASDAEWVAFQHQAWCNELCGYHHTSAYLLACIEAHVDPGTGLPPRAPASWHQIETRARVEVVRLAVIVDAIVSDYADHFGVCAAQAFADYVLAEQRARASVQPAQPSLFGARSRAAEVL